jgi:hypothetical protein
MDNADVGLEDSLESICYIFIFHAGAWLDISILTLKQFSSIDLTESSKSAIVHKLSILWLLKTARVQLGHI